LKGGVNVNQNGVVAEAKSQTRRSLS